MTARDFALACCSIALLHFASPADAQQESPGEPARQRFDARFANADTDHDGRLTREEAKAGMPNVYKHFDAIDTARQGSVSKDEIAAYFARKAKERRNTH
ncbi:calcium-binding protein [Cupriavidus necator]